MQYHTNSHGTDEAAFRVAALKAIEIASSNSTNQVLLLTHTLANLNGVISSVFGESFVKELTKTHVVKADQVTVYLETARFKSGFSCGVIFAPFVSSDLLAATLNDHRATDVVYVPWADTELQTYVQAHPTSVQI